MVLALEMLVPLKFSLVIEEQTSNTWLGGVGGTVTRQLVVGTFKPVTAWFTVGCTAWTGARPTSLTLTAASPETSIAMALPARGTKVPLSSISSPLIETTV